MSKPSVILFGAKPGGAVALECLSSYKTEQICRQTKRVFCSPFSCYAACL